MEFAKISYKNAFRLKLTFVGGGKTPDDGFQYMMYQVKNKPAWIIETGGQLYMVSYIKDLITELKEYIDEDHSGDDSKKRSKNDSKSN